MRASVSKPLASVAYGRSVARATSEPTAIRSVADATAPINVEHLERGATPSGAVAPEQVVVREHAVEPEASAAAATASDVPTSSRNDGNVIPTFTVTSAPAPAPRHR